MTHQLTYGSVCSGVEAASLAWEPLGLSPVWFAEIEEFPSMVLAERWPDVINLGDMTTIAERILAGEIPAPDVLVGGTPCQAFSLAGLRQGLKDKRGQLTLAFVELANAIDTRRAEEGKPPCIIVWENVPGVLSSEDNAYGNFLAGLAGESEPFEPGPRPADGKGSDYWTWSKSSRVHFAKWSKHGCVIGRERRLGWGIKDAQYFGVAQRRRRCFVVASARTDFDPTSIFLEPGSVCRDSAPSRETGQDLAAITGTGVENGSHWDNINNPHPTLSQSNSTSGIGGSNQEVFAQRGACIVEPIIMAHGQAGAEVNSEGTAPTLTCNHEAPIVYNNTGQGWWNEADQAATVRAGNHDGGGEARNSTMVTFPANMSGTQFAAAEGETAQTICAKNPTAIAFCSKDHGQDAGVEISPTLRSGNSQEATQTGSMAPAVCIPIHDKATRYKGGGDGRDNDGSQNGLGIGKPSDPCPTLDTSSHHAIAFAENDRNEVRYIGGDGQVTAPIQCGGGKPGQGYQAIVEVHGEGLPFRYGEHQQDTLHTDVMSTLPAGTKLNGAQFTQTVTPEMTIRRLTPLECERLQGMPDNHTLIPVNKMKRLIDDEIAYLRYHAPELPDDLIFKMAKDGPRYKAIGNSMAVPVMRWIMEQILAALPATCNEDLHVEDFGNDTPDVKPMAAKVKKKTKKVKPESRYARPFLKWAGGKFLQLDAVFGHMPTGVRLVEPFVGGGAVFLNAARHHPFECYLLADVNADLINLYQMLAIVPTQVRQEAETMFKTMNNQIGYDLIKGAFNDYAQNAIQRAAAFLYINRHCYNGLTRYNQKGIFNVGYAGYDEPYFPEAEMIRFLALAEKSVFMVAGFEKTLSLCGIGDVVYCDPPYEPMPGHDGFTGYASGGFTWADQERLARACVDAYTRGAKVVITNSSAPKIMELYQDLGFELHTFNAKRSISSKGSTREMAQDILGVLK